MNSLAQMIDLLDKAGVVLAWILALPVFATWYQISCGARRDRRRLWRQFRDAPGAYPVILIVDLLPNRNIRSVVERQRLQMQALREISAERIVELRRDAAVTTDTIAELQDELANAVARILDLGADTVHLFFAGPGVVAAMLGAELSNGPRVVLYQYQDGVYLNFGPLQASRQSRFLDFSRRGLLRQ